MRLSRLSRNKQLVLSCCVLLAIAFAAPAAYACYVGPDGQICCPCSGTMIGAPCACVGGLYKCTRYKKVGCHPNCSWQLDGTAVVGTC